MLLIFLSPPSFCVSRGKTVANFENTGMDRYERDPDLTYAVRELRKKVGEKTRAMGRLKSGNIRRTKKKPAGSVGRSSPGAESDGLGARATGTADILPSGPENNS